MYRIRSADGAEAVYSSLEEFAAAVRRGEVAPEDEIYHQRANRWLDVKSHPHFRSAMSWTGQGLPGSGLVSAPPASVSAPPPRPAATAPGNGSPHGHHPNSASDRLGVSRPVPPTVYRTPVSGSSPPAAPPTNSPPPAKSKELSFIDLGPPARPNNGTGSGKGAPPAPAKPTPSQPVDEFDFLVMATGLEAPVRKSKGHKAPAEDLDLLFDTPVANAAPPATPAAVSVPAHGANAPTPPPELPAGRISAPRATIVDPPRVAPIHPPIGGQVPALAEADLDLDTLCRADFEAAERAASRTSHPIHTVVRRSDKAVWLFASAAVVVAVTGGLLIWRPWTAISADINMVTTSATTTEQSAPPAGLMPQGLVQDGAGVAPVPVLPESTAAVVGAGDSAAQADSADLAAAEEIIATSRPAFRAPIEVAAPDLTPGTELRAQLSAEISTPTAAAPAEMVRRIEVAQLQAQQELAAQLVGFRNVFAAYRLDTREGVNQSRTIWNGGADAIRQYRARIGRLEKAYEDSVLASQRAHGWSGEDLRRWATRRSLAEPGEVSQLADLMFSQVAEALDILTALDGQYEIKNGVIRFRNPASGIRFTAVRTWVAQRRENWAATPESARPYTITAILGALGEGIPAVE